MNKKVKTIKIQSVDISVGLTPLFFTFALNYKNPFIIKHFINKPLN